MPYLLDKPDNLSPLELDARFNAYRAYLESARERLPRRAYEFASAQWHYDATDHRCPHDAWVNSLCIVEPAAGERRELRSLEIRMDLLGAYHNGKIRITYLGVQRYSLFQPFQHARQPSPSQSHGDWLVEEISASDNGRIGQPLAVHEIIFSQHGMWTFEAEDIVYEWIPEAD